MKRTILAVLTTLALAAPAYADPIFGTWKTIPDDNGNFGHIEVAACGAKICGKLVKSFDGSGQPVDSANIGRNIIWDMTAEGDGRYGGGKVWAPDRDKTYNSKLELSGDTLKVSGCVLGICRDGGSWSRVN